MADHGTQLIIQSMPMDDFQKYRAILDIDGNSWSSRFGKLLCYNSVVLKVDPKFVDYFYLAYLQPWKHFVPVRYDLSDLMEKAQWTLDPQNEAAVQAIVANANEFCRTHMVRSVLAEDLLDVWDSYLYFLELGDAQWNRQWEEKRKQIFASKEYDMKPVHLL